MSSSLCDIDTFFAIIAHLKAKNKLIERDTLIQKRLIPVVTLLLWTQCGFSNIDQSTDSENRLDHFYNLKEQSQAHHLYAPWRDKYLYNHDKKKEVKQKSSDTCVFCTQINEGKDQDNFIMARFDNCVVALNIFPYDKGHTLIIPYKHVKNLHDLSLQAQTELMWLISCTVELLQTTLMSDGVNVGINLGKAAGASIPDHLHIQILPRWFDNKGYIQLIGKTEVVCCDMSKLYSLLVPKFAPLKSSWEQMHHHL